MDKEFQVVLVSGQKNQIELINKGFEECGFKTTFRNFSVGYYFGVQDFITIVVTIIGTGGINSLLNNIIQKHKKHIKIKIENGHISELEVDSSMKASELTEFISEIRDTFENPIS